MWGLFHVALEVPWPTLIRHPTPLLDPRGQPGDIRGAVQLTGPYSFAAKQHTNHIYDAAGYALWRVRDDCTFLQAVEF